MKGEAVTIHVTKGRVGAGIWIVAVVDRHQVFATLAEHATKRAARAHAVRIRAAIRLRETP